MIVLSNALLFICIYTYICILTFTMSLKSPISSQSSLKFINTIGKLKLLKRTGWIHKDIPLPESVADHMYRMAMLSFLITDPAINRDRLIKVCLVHDLAEAVVGDITPSCGVSKGQKRQLEETALKDIVTSLGSPALADEIESLWLEYEEGTGALAQVAKQLDKFEMIVQADEYEQVHPDKDLEEFFKSTEGYFTHPEILSWANELQNARMQRILEKKASS